VAASRLRRGGGGRLLRHAIAEAKRALHEHDDGGAAQRVRERDTARAREELDEREVRDGDGIVRPRRAARGARAAIRVVARVCVRIRLVGRRRGTVSGSDGGSAAERRDLMDNCGNLEKPGAQFALGLDALAIIVSKHNPVEKITVQQVRRIFLGETTNWSELGGADQPIRLHARPERSGTYKHFSDAVLLGRSVPAAATRHAENTLLAEIVAADPAGIGFVPGANVGPAKVLKVGHEGSTTYSLPGEEEVRAGKYPAALCRYVYFYVPEQKPESPDVLARRNWPIAREFAEMSQNWRGQAIIASSGVITETTTLDEAGRARRIAGEPITKYLDRLRILEKKVRLRQIKMTPKLVNDEICPQLLFGFNQDVLTPESRNLIDKKLGPWLEMYPEIAKGGLVAEGWADSVGSDEACLKLSLKRAQNVADYISKTHRCKVTATGKGKSFDPPNTSEENKQRNRRVAIKRAVASTGGSGK
jgi:outer membrane protein OmpA-like peptidoglycan-associated protein